MEGDPTVTGQGIGSQALKLFLEKHIFPNYDACFVDPDSANIADIRIYEKAGFQKVKQVQDGKVAWMVSLRKNELLKLKKGKHDKNIRLLP